MMKYRLWAFLILCLSGVLIGTLGTWSWGLGHGLSAIWPALIVQVAGGIWFGAWGVVAGVLFPIISNTLARVGPQASLGFIPANLAQSIIPAWAFRHFRIDAAIPGRKGLLSYLIWGALIPSFAGGLLGSVAIVLFRQESWSAYPSLVLKWATPHVVISVLIGAPVLRIFTPLWRDLGVLVRGWWGLDGAPAPELSIHKPQDLPIQLKLVLALCGPGIAPLLALSIVELRRGGAADHSHPMPLFLTISLVASILAVGWLSREVVRPLLELKREVEHLMQGRGVSLPISRQDEIGQVGRAFEVLLRGRRQAEEAVRRSEAQLREFIDNAPYAITRTSVKEDRLLSANPALVKMLGYDTEAEVLALRMSSDVYFVSEDRRQIVERLSPSGEFGSVETRWKRRDGQPITVQGVARIVPAEPDSDDWIIEGIVQDITQRRLLEEQLRQAQKMEAVGRLAGGVAHDFNNLLSVILGYSELLAGELASDPQRQKRVQAIRGAGERAAALTSQLLAFSRRQVLQPEVANLNAIVLDTEKMLGRLIGEHIELKLILEPEPGSIKADPGQITQVIMNLALNARDAMPSGGILTIATANICLQHDAIEEGGVAIQAGQYARLTVSDTGVGMDAVTRARLFEPFFTTKSVGEGTGLGLATVYGIVTQSAGRIVVHSEREKGSVFAVYFPQVQADGTAAPARASVPEETKGSGTVLLVEDAPALRELVRESLEGLGYTILTAGNGVEALHLAERYAGPIRVMITDVVMPQMGGPELKQRLSALHPEAKVLYMSGYASDAMARLQIPHEAFIQKPFALEALARRLREVLSHS